MHLQTFTIVLLKRTNVRNHFLPIIFKALKSNNPKYHNIVTAEGLKTIFISPTGTGHEPVAPKIKFVF